MSESVVSVSIRAQVSDLIAGMKEAASGVDSSTRQMADSMKAHSKSATEGSTAHNGLLSTLREFKQEQVQSGRVASFYASQIAEVVPGAAAAQGAIRGLIGALLEGGGIGAGFELAMLAVGQFKEAIEAEEKRVAELRQQHRATLAEITDAVRDAAKAYAGWKTETDKVGDSIQENATKKIRALRGEIEDLEKKRAHHIFGDLIGSSDETDAIQEKLRLIHQLQSDVSGPKAEKQLAGLADAESVARSKQLLVEESALIRAHSDEAVKIRAERDARLEALDAQLAAATRKNDQTSVVALEGLRISITSEAETRLKDLRIARATETDAQLRSIHGASMTAEEKLVAEQQTKLAALELQFAHRKDKENLAALQNAVIAETDLRLQELRGRHDYEVYLARKTEADAAREREQIDRAIREEKKQQWKDVATSISGSISYAFEQMAAGAASFGQAMSGILKSVLQLTIQIVQKTVLAYAAESAAKAYASQAMIPVIGPILGAAAAAAALGLVGGLVSRIPGFAEGGRYQGGPMLVGERGPEVVVPDGSGTVVPNHALGGVTINVSALDGASARAYFESPGFARVWRELQRNGRIG